MTSQVKKMFVGIAGLKVCQEPHKEILFWINRTLKSLEKLPTDSRYRIITADLLNKRKDLVANNLDPEQLESKLGCQCEELIEEVKAELKLSEIMSEYEPWKPLEEKAPADQWKWPI